MMLGCLERDIFPVTIVAESAKAPDGDGVDKSPGAFDRAPKIDVLAVTVRSMGSNGGYMVASTCEASDIVGRLIGLERRRSFGTFGPFLLPEGGDHVGRLLAAGFYPAGERSQTARDFKMTATFENGRALEAFWGASRS